MYILLNKSSKNFYKKIFKKLEQQFNKKLKEVIQNLNIDG